MEVGSSQTGNMFILLTLYQFKLMESVALGYLDIEEEVIESLREEHKNNKEKFKQELLHIWGTDLTFQMAATNFLSSV